MNTQQTTFPHKLLTIITGLFSLAGLFWIGYAIYAVAQGTNIMRLSSIVGFGIGLLFIALAYFIYRKKLWAFWAGLVLLVLNIILTLADKASWGNFIYLVYIVVLFILLFQGRSSFKQMPVSQ